jgi:LmbE family N-acetylglucosaminyl deacetylase
MMMLDLFRNKKCMVVVAHHDDECLYFGGLLSQIGPICRRLDLVVMTDPAPGRADTATRRRSFTDVCVRLGAGVLMHDLVDFASHTSWHLVQDQLPCASRLLGGDLLSMSPDIIVTHGIFGEPTPVYRNGHVMHRLVHKAIVHAIEGLHVPARILTCGLGNQHTDHTLAYQPGAKKELMDFYLPHWEPLKIGYDFAYEPETYVRIA